MKQGVIKIRKMSKVSIGTTFPIDLVKDFDITAGIYKYSAEKTSKGILLRIETMFDERRAKISNE